MDKPTLIVLLTMGFILIGIAIRFRGSRFSLWSAAVGIVVVVATIALRVLLGG